ncbi:MAG: aldehyde dehydrogenase (NADP(+)) [Acidimicrobiia bacterium]
MISEPTGANLIGGTEGRQGPQTFTAFDPRNGRPGSVRFHEATTDEIDRATREARVAFESLRAWGNGRVAELLRAIAGVLEGHRGEVVSTADQETRLGESRLEGELTRTTLQILAFADYVEEGSYVEAIIDLPDPKARPIPRPDLRRMLVPLGPVAVFGAGNFPLAFGVPGGDTASALAARCPVVAKAHPSHPGTSELTARIISAAVAEVGAPAGTFSLVQGQGPEVGRALVLSPHIKAVGFTGSHTVGRALHELGATRPEPIPVYAEMGSINPVFVTQGALRARAEQISEGFVASMTLGSGQFCTKPGLVFVPDDETGDLFIERTAGLLSQMELGPMLNERLRGALREKLARTTRLEGVAVAFQGRPSEEPGFGCAPTLLAIDCESFLAQPELLEEHFGPVSIVVRCPTKRMQEAAEHLPGSLTVTVHAQPEETDRVRVLQQALVGQAGRLIWNGFPTGVAVTAAMQHGGPYPATVHREHTSVGLMSIRRFLRPVSYQDTPQSLLPPELQDHNPLGILRRLDGEWTRVEAVAGQSPAGSAAEGG